MRALCSWLGLLGALALAGIPAPAGAQPVGAEFQVNTYTTFYQSTGTLGGNHLVGADANGNFVIVWNGQGQGDTNGVFGQRFDSSGEALGSEFRVSAYTPGPQGLPSVAAAADGHFVVVWRSEYQDGDSSGIIGQRYDSGGSALGSEFIVNSYTPLGQLGPAVASDASGNFVVVWYGNEGNNNFSIFGQRFDSSGEALGSEFRVSSDPTSTQAHPSVASDASGNFVVAWSSLHQDGSSWGIFGQRFDRAGVAQGDEFRVNTFTTDVQVLASVASDASGNFVVVWEGSGQDGDSDGIFAQRYDSSGEALGSEFRVNSYTTDSQVNPSVASDASGNFVVVWHSALQDGSGYGVFSQRYDSAGVAQGEEFQINSYTTARQWLSSVGTTGANQFVVAWTSDGQDGSRFGVFGQRFDFAGDTIKVETPNTNVKWRIGSLERIKWTHNLGLSATFRIELDRDDDGSYEELIAAAAPADSATRGHFAWTVTGPPSATARVRVSWTDDPSVSDASDVTFQIRPVPVSATARGPQR